MDSLEEHGVFGNHLYLVKLRDLRGEISYGYDVKTGAVVQTGFFFQGNAILVPPDFQGSGEANEISLDFLDDFRECPAPGPFFNQTDNQTDCIANIANIEQFELPDLLGTLPIRAVNISPDARLPPGWKALPVRERLPHMAIGDGGNGPAGRLLRAFHIAQWRGESRFCGSCGAKNVDSREELARLCPACGRLDYPRIAPAIIVIITNDTDQILLAHNKKFSAGIYSLIAGFNEAGESLEATVRREVREEVNIEIRDITYIVSQPWPFPNSLMLAFSARHARGEIKPDGVEIDDARWWNRDALPHLPGNASVSRWLINRWLDKAL